MRGPRGRIYKITQTTDESPYTCGIVNPRIEDRPALLPVVVLGELYVAIPGHGTRNVELLPGQLETRKMQVAKSEIQGCSEDQGYRESRAPRMEFTEQLRIRNFAMLLCCMHPGRNLRQPVAKWHCRGALESKCKLIGKEAHHVLHLGAPTRGDVGADDDV